MKRLIELVITPPRGIRPAVLDGIAVLRAAFARSLLGLERIEPESWWFRRFAICRQADWPAAPFRARGGAAGYRLCADPVHLAVSGDAVVLDGAVSLSQAEAQGLIERLNGHFAADGLQVFAVSPSEWVLESSTAIDAATRPTPSVHGRSIETFLPRGPDARVLKRFGNEAQMLLHDAPVNLDREARGEAPVNGVWLWGGGQAGAVTATGRPLAVLSDAAHVRGIAQAAGAVAAPLPAGIAAALAAHSEDLILDLAAPYAYPEGWPQWLADTWLEPLRGSTGRVLAHVILPGAGASTTLFARDYLAPFRRGGLARRLAEAGMNDAPG